MHEARFMYFLSLGETKEKLEDGGAPELRFHCRETTESHFSSHQGGCVGIELNFAIAGGKSSNSEQ